MKIQSLGIDGERITVIFGDGEKEEFRRCPFSNCGLHHSTELVVCTTTGEPIVEEWKRRKEAARREKLAEEARTRYREKYLPEWMEKMLARLLLLATVILLFYIFFSPSSLKNLTIGIGSALFILTIPWDIWKSRREKRIKEQADAIYQRVLKGEEV